MSKVSFSIKCKSFDCNVDSSGSSYNEISSHNVDLADLMDQIKELHHSDVVDMEDFAKLIVNTFDYIDGDWQGQFSAMVNRIAGGV